MGKVKTPTVQFVKETSPSGNNYRTVKLFSYVALLTERDGCEVKAARYDGYKSKYDLHDTISADYPDWNLKGIYKLCDDDFKGDG